MSQAKRDLNLTYAFLTIAMICWGLSFVWYKQALLSFKPISLVFFRLIISFPLLMIAALLMKKLQRIKRKDIPLFLLLAFLEPLIYFLGESFGMQFVSSTVASILIATIPLITSLAAFILLNEKLSLQNYFGMAISFAGVLAVVFADTAALDATWKGVFLIMIAVFAALGYGLLIKRVANKYNSFTIVAVQNFIGALYFLPLFVIFDFKQVAATTWSFKMIVPMLYLSVFASTIAYIGFIQGLRKLGVAKASVFANFIPVFTAVFAFIILGERMSAAKIGGICLVVSGLILSQAGKRNKKKSAEPIIVDELY
jgi:drug/metabolite transporter (DMT)-like permease